MYKTGNKIGFMQGRLSPLIDGRIQSFPWDHWENEFLLANRIGLNLMEWTLDHENIFENPLMTKSGQKKILHLCDLYNFRIPSLTGDCFMQAPFWKASKSDRKLLEETFLAIAHSCNVLGINYIVVPLVDNGSLENHDQEKILVGFLESQINLFSSLNLKIIFESDFEPIKLANFISRLDTNVFGINYDIGNSAALGFNPFEEFASYGDRIVNVHVKDRIFGGTTVPLGSGDADFNLVFKCLTDINYAGNYIMQTARAKDNDHSAPLILYRSMIMNWINVNRLNND